MIVIRLNLQSGVDVVLSLCTHFALPWKAQIVSADLLTYEFDELLSLNILPVPFV